MILGFGQNAFAQAILNNYWQTTEIIGQELENVQEFELRRIDTTANKYWMYGNLLKFGKDKTFSSHYSAPCGNDCFPSSLGTYKMLDKEHISIFVKEFNQTGDCEHKQVKLNRDLGSYFITNQSKNTIKLIKSNGDKKQDKLNEKYSSKIDDYFAEIKNGSSNVLDFETDLVDNKQRVVAYLKAKTKIKNYKIVYSKKEGNQFIINLVQNMDAVDDYFYIVNGFRNNFQYKVGYYKLKDTAK